MNDHRELLELAALAMGYEYTKPSDDYDGSLGLAIGSNPMRTREWNPRRNSGQCADMCAALGIDTRWLNERVACTHCGLYIYVKFTDHNGDKSAAWRLAALRVAAEIGKGMRG